MYVELGKATFCQESWHVNEDRVVLTQRTTPSGERLIFRAEIFSLLAKNKHRFYIVQPVQFLCERERERRERERELLMFSSLSSLLKYLLIDSFH